MSKLKSDFDREWAYLLPQKSRVLALKMNELWPSKKFYFWCWIKIKDEVKIEVIFKWGMGISITTKMSVSEAEVTMEAKVKIRVFNSELVDLLPQKFQGPTYTIYRVMAV